MLDTETRVGFEDERVIESELEDDWPSPTVKSMGPVEPPAETDWLGMLEMVGAVLISSYV